MGTGSVNRPHGSWNYSRESQGRMFTTRSVKPPMWFLRILSQVWYSHFMGYDPGYHQLTRVKVTINHHHEKPLQVLPSLHGGAEKAVCTKPWSGRCQHINPWEYFQASKDVLPGQKESAGLHLKLCISFNAMCSHTLRPSLRNWPEGLYHSDGWVDQEGYRNTVDSTVDIPLNLQAAKQTSDTFGDFD